MGEKRSWDDLPEECWESVLNRLTQHLESVSSVCKRFFSISNRLKSNLTITTHRSVTRLLQRFPQLKQMDIVEFHLDLDQIIREIARSDLCIEALNLSKQKRIPVEIFKEFKTKRRNSLRSLICSKLWYLKDSDLVKIGDLFPQLQELDISYPDQYYSDSEFSGIVSDAGFVSDEGIESLSLNLPILRKINLSGNHFISDNSLIALASNCKFLTEIAICDCSFISQRGIHFLMNYCTNLVSISINGNKNLSFLVRRSVPSPKALQVVDLSLMLILDEFLYSLAMMNLPLEKLRLSFCKGFTIDGIRTYLCMNRSLKCLDLEGVDFLTDHSMERLSPYLHDVTSINLNSCSNLTTSTFFTLLKNCPRLVEIRMAKTRNGQGDYTPTFPSKIPEIRSLELASNKYLTDEILMMLVFVCPGLRSLDVSHCLGITEQGIQEVGKMCKEITELKLNGCVGVHNLGDDVEFSKLEVVQASGSGINDEGLKMIGKSCRGLVCLDLDGCFNVSDKGMKEVVKKCERLKEVRLKYCDAKGDDRILAWMVFTRPSLKKIIPPFGVAASDVQRDLFSRHGCMVCFD